MLVEELVPRPHVRACLRPQRQRKAVMQSSRKDVYPPKDLNIALPSLATYITAYCTYMTMDFEDSRFF